MPYFEAMGTRGERLKKARIDAGYRSARDASESLGIKYSTYAGHENGSRAYGADEAAIYARKFKVSSEWLLYGRSGTVTTVPISPLATIPVIGIVRAGLWQDADAGDAGLYQVVPAAADAPAEWQFALAVEGTSLNRIALPGDILICMDIVKARYEFADGDLVIVERSRFAGQMVERTAKRIKRVVEGFELWPESDDPAFQSPIRLNGVEDGAEVRIIAKVLWVMRRP
jgi:phage repressor protein C with HTH and peptisase S24 domain